MRSKTWFVALLLLPLCWACSAPDQSEQNNLELPDDGCFYSDATRAVLLGEWQIFADQESGHWWVRTSDGARVVESPGSCPDLGRQRAALRIGDGEPKSQFSFGSLRLEFQGRDVEVEWEAFEGAYSEWHQDDNSLRLVWRDSQERAVHLEFSLLRDRDLSIALGGREGDIAGELNLGCRDGEAFFGLGTQVTGMELRGRIYPLWTQEQGNGKRDNPTWPLENYLEAAYAPMGVWHSSQGYTALLGHDALHELDLCANRETVLSLRSYPDPPQIVLLSGADPKERMTSLTEYVGRIDTAPDWVFGPWNDAVSGPWRLWQVADMLREHQIPSSAIWSEDWIGGAVTPTGFRLSYRWSWDPDTYPDLPADIENLQARGFAFLAYFNPFVPTTVPRYPEAVEEGFLIKDEDGEPYLLHDPAFRQASLVDLSSEEARQWTLSFMEQAITELNIDGWMADFAEWLPLDAVLASGESPWRFRNRYPVAWQQVNRQAFENARPGSDNWTFFARSGWASATGGTPGISPTLWGGDQNTDWGYDDGLPSIVPIGAHAGLAGVAIYGSDIAGYSSLGKDNTSKELFLRWAAIGAFHPLMRTHHGGDKCGNWMFDSDQETLVAYRRLARIHTLLLPYFRLLRQEAMDYGWPMIRHSFLVEGADERLWTGEQYQFFLGDDLLVAPVLEEGATTRPVALPAGRWWPLFGSEPTDEAQVEAQAAVSDIPVFARGGTLIPLLMRPVDSFYGATDPEVSDLSDVEGQYRVALYPDEEGRVHPGPVGSAEVSVEGLTGLVDWRSARVDGSELAECADESAVDCAASDRLVLQAESARIEVEGAVIEIRGEGQQTFRLGVGAQAWGELAPAPPITDLDPPFSSYCDELP